MKILLSAFSCLPNRGSEPGVGWGFFTSLAKDHEILLLTRRSNQNQIEAAMDTISHPDRVDILYFDLPGIFNFYKPGTSRAHLYYFLWQIGIFFKVRRLTRFLSFDLIHHVTYGVYRTPSLLAFLDIPFIFGPVGGGETYPLDFRKKLPWRYRVSDIFREAINRLSVYNPILNKMYQRSELIICRTPETQRMIPAAFHDKCVIELGLGIDLSLPSAELLEKIKTYTQPSGKAPFKLLFVGRPAYWKGLNFIIEVYAELLSRDYPFKLTFIGLGDNSWPEEIARRLHIHDQIEWIENIPFEELIATYAQHDLLLFPSLRELGGNAILEAFANSLPVLCLDLGYGTNLVEQDTGILIHAPGKKFEEVIQEMADKIVEVYEDKSILEVFAKNAKLKSKRYLYANIVDRVYSRITDLQLTKASPESKHVVSH